MTKSPNPFGPYDSSHDALAQRYAFFEDLIEGVQVVDFDLRYLYLNPVTLLQARLPKEKMLGWRMADAFPGFEKTEAYGRIEACARNRKSDKMLNQFTHADGSQNWFELRFSPIPEGVLIYSLDVTEWIDARNAAQRHREELAAVLDAMDVAVFGCEANCNISVVNRAAEKMSGMKSDALMGQSLAHILALHDEDGRSKAEDEVMKTIHEGSVRTLLERHFYFSRDGRQFPVEGVIAPLRSSEPGKNGMVVMLKDVTREKQTLEMLQQSQKLEAVGQLAGGVAHDYNNLMAVILGYLSLVDEGSLPAEWKVNFLGVKKAAESAVQLTKQLLAFARKQMVEPRVVSVSELARHVESNIKLLVGESVELKYRLKSEPLNVLVDPVQLEQVILNLAANARDAMPKGGFLSIETEIVALDQVYVDKHPGTSAGKHVCLSICDSGVGMDEATLARAFEPFYTTKALGRGTGLGLATSYGIVRQAGGHIYAYSEPGKGTCFRIYLPEYKGALTKAPESKATEASHTGHETILVVEDVADLLEVERAILSRLGYKVLLAPNGAKALEVAAAFEGEIHLLISDMVMPGLPSADLARALKAKRPQIKILFMSGYTSDSLVQQSMLEKGSAFLPKPFTLSSLGKKVREVLDA